MDSLYIEGQMQSKTLFPAIKDLSVRAGILQRLLEVKQPILSIYTLFKDLRYLDPAARAMRALLPKRTQESLRVSFSSLFLPKNTGQSLEIQDSETSYTAVSGDRNYLFGLAYRGLFLCAIRYFTNPSNVSFKKDMNPIEQTADGTKRYLGFRLLKFGQRIGFSIQTDQDALIDPNERLLADMLRSLPKEIFNTNEPIPKTLSDLFNGYLTNSTLAANAISRPSLTTPGVGEPLSQRCGRCSGGPLDDEDRLHLFIRKMHAPLSEFPRGGYDISSFYVKRSIYQAFFGETRIQEMTEPPAQDSTEEGISEIRVANAAEDVAMHNGAGDGIPTNLTPTATEQPPQLDPTLFTHAGIQKSSELNVDFISQTGDIRATSLFTRDGVEGRAVGYANAGFSLMDERGRHWLWSECFDALVETETRKIMVLEPAAIEDGPMDKQAQARRAIVRNRARLSQTGDTDLLHKALLTIEEGPEDRL